MELFTYVLLYRFWILILEFWSWFLGFNYHKFFYVQNCKVLFWFEGLIHAWTFLFCDRVSILFLFFTSNFNIWGSDVSFYIQFENLRLIFKVELEQSNHFFECINFLFGFHMNYMELFTYLLVTFILIPKLQAFWVPRTCWISKI